MMFVVEQPETVSKKCVDEVMMEAQGRNYIIVRHCLGGFYMI